CVLHHTMVVLRMPDAISGEMLGNLMFKQFKTSDLLHTHMIPACQIAKSIHAVIIVKLPDKTCLYTQTKITEVVLSLRILAHQFLTVWNIDFFIGNFKKIFDKYNISLAPINKFSLGNLLSTNKKVNVPDSSLTNYRRELTSTSRVYNINPNSLGNMLKVIDIQSKYVQEQININIE
ncbi:hypothetical protein L9F63_022012, partial [Diploptera punctata]